MGFLTIPEGTFFTQSPEIRVRCQKEDDKYVLDTIEKEGRILVKGATMNCFQRPASDEEREGHEARLSGVLRMDKFLRRMGDKATVRYHGQKKGWVKNISSSMDACSMLAYSDKWWMLQWDNKNLNRLGSQRRQQESCVPLELQGGLFYRRSGSHCMYCGEKADEEKTQIHVDDLHLQEVVATYVK